MFHISYRSYRQPSKSLPFALFLGSLWSMNRWVHFLMFVTVFSLVYGGVHLYLFKRVRAYVTFSRAGNRALAVFFTLMAVLPIVSRMVSWNSFFWLGYSLVLSASLWMGYAFYFLLLNLAVDSANLLYRVLKRIFAWPRPLLLPKNGAVFATLLVVPLAICTYAYYEAADIRLTEVRIRTAKLPAGTDHLTIAQISDVHLGMIIREERLDRIVLLLRKARPDIIVSTGDLFDQETDGLGRLADRFESLKPKFGKYAVLGNHEFYAGVDKFLRFAKEAGFQVLRGDCVVVPGLINIIGIDDPTAKYVGATPKGDLATVFAQRNPDLFTLFLFHRPPNSEDYLSRLPIDLQLSGHTHGGQLFPFRVLTRIFFPLNVGLYAADGKHLYVSRGTGTWGPPLRFLAPPEVTLIRLIRST